MQAGGRAKLLSKLTEAQTIDVRTHIAATADVSVGNVTKVKQLLGKAPAQVLEAVCSGEISIHRASLWIHEPPEEQLEKLRLRRIERGIKKKAKALVAEHRAEVLPSTTDPPFFTVSDLGRLVSCLSTMFQDESTAFGEIDLAVINVPGKGIYMTRELVQAFGPPTRALVR